MNNTMVLTSAEFFEALDKWCNQTVRHLSSLMLDVLKMQEALDEYATKAKQLIEDNAGLNDARPGTQEQVPSDPERVDGPGSEASNE